MSYPIRIGGMIAVLGVAFALQAGAMAEEIKVDSYEIVGPAPAQVGMVIREFSTEKTDFGAMKKKKQKEVVSIMKDSAPMSFQEALVRRLSESGAFPSVEAAKADELAEGSLVVEGEFTVLNPGNRAKRFWVGFGAGKSKVCVAGRVANAAGEELVRFDDCRSGTGMWAFSGGRPEGMMTNDIYQSAYNLAEFLESWGKGALPTVP